LTVILLAKGMSVAPGDLFAGFDGGLKGLKL
jgi:hypothetical protein